MSLKVVTALKARQNFGTIMNAVSFKNDQYIVERKGMPMVAIIPVKKFGNRSRVQGLPQNPHLSTGLQGMHQNRSIVSYRIPRQPITFFFQGNSTISRRNLYETSISFLTDTYIC